jgi:hypothetical protein
MGGAIKIYVDLAGNDNIPHVFAGVADSQSVHRYLGYGPANHGSPVGKGQIYRGIANPDGSKNAGNMLQVAWASESLPTSDAQTQAILSCADEWEAHPGQYVGVGFKHNCASFVKALLKAAGIDYRYSGITDLPSSFIPYDLLANYYDPSGMLEIARQPLRYPETPASVYKQLGEAAIAPQAAAGD